MFYIVFFGKIVCPDMDKAWNVKEVGFHATQDDFYVAVRGSVYDISNFWRVRRRSRSTPLTAQGQHSDIVGNPVTRDDMLELAGKDLCARD